MSRDQIWAATLQKSNVWMKELSGELGLGLEDTLLAFRTVTHALRDRLPPIEAAHLAAQLPLLLKGVYFDGWKPGGTPVKLRDALEFLQYVRVPLERGIRNVDVLEVTQTVLRYLANHLSDGEIEQIRAVLPAEMRELLPERSTV